MEDSFRADAKRTILVNLFMDDIADGNYKLIQKMYEIAGVQKKELQEQRTIRRGYNANLSKKIFYDIRDILIEKIIGDEVIEQAFIDLCSVRWPDVVTMYETILEDLEKYYNIWKKLDDFRGYFLDYLLVNNKSLSKEDYHDKMDLNVEIIDDNRYAMSHNYELNGDLMADPDVEFTVDKDNRLLYPESYQQDNLQFYQRVDKDPVAAHQLNEFMDEWLNNIQENQYKVKAVYTEEQVIENANDIRKFCKENNLANMAPKVKEKER